MSYLSAVILAAVEGITEFLPISSTGHLILVEKLLKFTDDPEFNKAFMIVIQFPAILAVVIYFWKELWPLVSDPGERRKRITLWAKIVLAFMPVAIIGLLLSDTINTHLLAPMPVAIALLVGGIALLAVERMPHKETWLTHAEITFRAALFIGCFQCLALFPGTSRSAATIIGALILGASRPLAAEFSFFLAIPTMTGATVYTIAKSGLDFSAHEWGLIAVGSVVSFAVAYSVIAWLMAYIRTKSFAPFGYYRIALALIIFGVYLAASLSGDS